MGYRREDKLSRGDVNLIHQHSPGVALLERPGSAPTLLQGFGASSGAALHAQEHSGAAFRK